MDAAATSHSIDCDENMSRDELIENYFYMGFKYLEIIMFLAVMHGHTLGLRQLKRILRERNLFRRKFKDDISTVADVIEQSRATFSERGPDETFQSSSRAGVTNENPK